MSAKRLIKCAFLCVLIVALSTFCIFWGQTITECRSDSCSPVQMWMRMSRSTPRMQLDSRASSLNRCSRETALCGDDVFFNSSLVSSSNLPLDSLGLDALKFIFHGLLSTLEFTCPTKQGFGAAGLGVYEICMVHRAQPKPGSCIVYSFGISGDWSFDEHLAKFGCEVHSFDPSIGKEDHVHSSNVTFHNIGLWGSDVTNNKGWKMRRFSTIRKMLHHKRRVIDVLKVDAELAEWPFLRDVLFRKRTQLLSVKQIMMELHSPRSKNETLTSSDFREMISYMAELRKIGFRVFKNFHKGNCCGAFAPMMPPEIPEMCCEEVALINERFLPKPGDVLKR